MVRVPQREDPIAALHVLPQPERGDHEGFQSVGSLGNHVALLGVEHRPCRRVRGIAPVLRHVVRQSLLSRFGHPGPHQYGSSGSTQGLRAGRRGWSACPEVPTGGRSGWIRDPTPRPLRRGGFSKRTVVAPGTWNAALPVPAARLVLARREPVHDCAPVGGRTQAPLEGTALLPPRDPTHPLETLDRHLVERRDRHPCVGRPRPARSPSGVRPPRPSPSSRPTGRGGGRTRPVGRPGCGPGRRRPRGSHPVTRGSWA